MGGGGQMWFDHRESNARGVAIAAKKGLSIKVKKIVCSQEGRWLILDATINGKTFTIANVYAPNTDNRMFFQNCVNNLNTEAEHKIIAGDLNVVLNEELDYKSRSTQGRHNVKAAATINSFLEEKNWIDVWRIKNPDKFQFTWKRTKPLCLSRLDYFLIPQENLGFIADCQIISGIESDHHFV